MLYFRIVAVLVLTFCLKINAEAFISREQLEVLFETEKTIIDDLEVYIQKEEEKIVTIKRLLNSFKKDHDQAMEDIDYIDNPINIFKLIKKFTIDLNDIHNTIKERQDYVNNITMRYAHVMYSNMDYLKVAVEILTRLQRIYLLEITDLAEGMLNGVKYSQPMTTSDCYELGRILYDDGDYKNAIAWMFEALQKYYAESILNNFSDNDILDYIANACYELALLKEDANSAKEWIQKVLALDPTHPRAEDMLAYYQTLLIVADEETTLNGDFGQQIQKSKHPLSGTEADLYMDSYEALCRGELELPVQLSSRLTCRYFSESHPFLLIAPFKIEMLYQKPDIILFHEIISDDEIEELKRLAMPKFSSSYIIDRIRTSSKLAWLDEEGSDTVTRIIRRVVHMTGLTQEMVDNVQVLNYAIGEYYIPHYDFFVPLGNDSVLPTNGKGNRIATTLFYMSDLDKGGATVFPKLGVRMQAVKGTALLWYNLHASGEKDYAVMHAACPVLQGSKWVFTRWMYDLGQEFVKPCNLEHQMEDLHTRNIPQPVTKSFNHEVQYSF